MDISFVKPVGGTTNSMKHLFLLLILLISSCTYYEEPPQQQELPVTQQTEQVTQYNFTGTYVTEDLQGGIELYDNFSFAYKPDVNNQQNDYTSWRIGLWNYQNDTVFVRYEDGGNCQIIPFDDKLTYYEKDTTLEFVRSTQYTIVVGKDPSFNGEH